MVLFGESIFSYMLLCRGKWQCDITEGRERLQEIWKKHHGDQYL